MNPCIVVDCASARRAMKLCPKHYEAEKRGMRLAKKPTFLDSIGRKHPISAKRRDWLLDFLERQEFSDSCIEWPFPLLPNGYGNVRLFYDQQVVGAHVAICLLTRGPKPTPKHHAAHSCGNRECVNPGHLRWATPKQNNLDKQLHGTRQNGENNPLATISNAQALSIAADSRPYKEIAASTGATLNIVKQIKAGTTWSSITGIKK